MAWRSEDDALLARLEDERALHALWRAEAPEAAPLHPRAAGMMALLRERPHGAEAFAALEAGDAEPIGALLRPASFAGLSPMLLHHLAVYNARLADAPRVSPNVRERCRIDSLAAWIALADERTYLERLARAVLADQDEVSRAVDGAAIAPLESLGQKARAGARDLTDEARSALQVLGHVSDACRRSGCTPGVQRRFELHAERRRAAAIDEALAPISAAMTDATARGQAEREGAELMDRTAAVWVWAGADEHVERFAIDTVTPIAWNIYHEEHSDGRLRRLLAPLEPLVERLAWRIQADASRIAYAAPCAQMYVFRAEMSSSGPEQRKYAERSLEICPSHRNGRLILANLLVHEVRDRLDRTGLLLQGGDFREMEEKLSRAEELYPRARGLDELKAAVKQARARSWWGR